jgi:hypothetical protein
MTVRVHQFKPSPDAEAVVATIRRALGDADERRPAPRETLLLARPRDARAARERIVEAVRRYHPCWRNLVGIWIDDRWFARSS